MRIFLCSPSPRTLTPRDVRIVSRFYSDDALRHPEHRAAVGAFLRNNFGALEKAYAIAALSTHDAEGSLRLAVFMREEEARSYQWRLIGQAGHGVVLPFTHRCVGWRVSWHARLMWWRLVLCFGFLNPLLPPSNAFGDPALFKDLIARSGGST